MRMERRFAIVAFALSVVFLLLSGCGSGTEPLTPNQRPQASAIARPPEPMDSLTYVVQFTFTSQDPEGRVSHHLYAIDPPAQGDTLWVQTKRTQLTLTFPATIPEDPLPPDGPVTSSDYHVFAFKAVDDRGLLSPAAFFTFTAVTIAPQTQIISPPPDTYAFLYAPDPLEIRWEGEDPDGVISQQPVQYKYRLVSESEIRSELNLISGPSADDLQRYFSRDAPAFTSWDSVPRDSAYARLKPPGTWRYYFAVSAIDEAGAYEPRFLLDRNVLRITFSTYAAAPRITIFNSFFSRTQGSGGIDLSERSVFRLEVPANGIVEFNWFAEAGATRSVVTSYRWVFDPIDGNIFDETPRENDSQINRWSVWSLYETHVALGPFAVQPGEQIYLRLYVQARDNFGSISMITVELRLVEPTFEKPLLVFDDFQASPDRFPNLQPFGSFPTEAVLDTLLHAVGGKPYKARPLGTLSDPGVFAGFAHDTLDFRFLPYKGLPLSILGHYQAVIWLISAEDATRTAGKFFSQNPMSGFRFINTVGELNTLGVYLLQGGKVWLFGDGVAPAIGNGYVSRFDEPFARYPFTRKGDGASPTSILWPGNFLYDYLHARSKIEIVSSSPGLADMVPYLPTFRTPGAPWPPDDWTGNRGAMDDPRVGPSSERNQQRWEGLPMLTMTTEFPDWPGPFPTSLLNISYVSLPNEILEDHDADPVTPKVSRLDTLYLMRAQNYNLSSLPNEPDGKPVFFYYWGEDHGPVAWTSVPLWYFERTQLQTVAELVLREFGIVKNSDPRTWQGPGSANDKLPRLVGTP